MKTDQGSIDSSGEQEFRVRSAVSLAINFLVTNLGQLFVLVLQAFLLGAVAEFIFSRSELFVGLIYGALFAPVSVAIHRAIVLQEPLDATQYLPSFRHVRVWKFLGYGVLFGVAFFLLVALVSVVAGGAILASMNGGFDSSLNVLIIVGLAIGIYVLIRFAFVWPAIATDQFRSLRDSGKRMRGMAWRVFGALLIVSLPIIVLGFLAGLMHPLLQEAVSYLLGSLGTAVLSFAYVSASAE